MAKFLFLLTVAGLSCAQEFGDVNVPDIGEPVVPGDIVETTIGVPVDPVTTPAVKLPPCGIDNWLQTPFKSCVKIFQTPRDAPITWDEAQQECRGHGGDMYMVTDQTRSKWMRDLVSKYHRGRAFWLGGKYENGGWVWKAKTGSKPLTFGEFTPGEPNLRIAQLNDACIIFGANLRWWDDPCTTKNPVIDTICEKPMNINNGVIG